MFPVIVCGLLIIFGGLIVVLGHRQGDANAIIASRSASVAAAATAAVKATAPPSASATATVSASPKP